MKSSVQVGEDIVCHVEYSTIESLFMWKLSEYIQLDLRKCGRNIVRLLS